MRLLHIINCLATGGAEKLLVDIVPRFRKKGIDVDVLLLNGASYPLKDQLQSVFEGKIICLDDKSIYSPYKILMLKKYIHNYDIIHVHLFPAVYWVSISARLFNISSKIIFTEHSTSNKRFRQSWTIPFDRVIYARYTRIIGISEKISQFVSTRFRLETIETIQNGVDIKEYQEATRYDSTELTNILGISKRAGRLIIQVSSFQEPKDHATVIQSLKYLENDVNLVLVGTGGLLDATKSMVRELGLSDRVVFLGLRSDVPRLLKSADVVVLSSKYEGMSLSSIEGMASGRPFVASDVPGLTEIVEGAGVLFPQGDSERLAHEINRLLADKRYYNDVVKKCQERASSYDISVMVEKHIELYESLLKA